MAGGSLKVGGFDAGSFIVSFASNYLVSRYTAQDGPRLDNLTAASGEYGVPRPRGYGSHVRLTGAFIAQADIKETSHTVKDYSTIVGAIGGAAQGFMIGGPVGALIGGAIGGLLGFAAPKQHYYTYSDTFALFFLDRLNDDPVEGLTMLWAGGKLMFTAAESPVVGQLLDSDGRLIWRKYGQNKFFKSLTIYGGHRNQPVDPVLAAAVEEDGGYPFSHYIVIEDLQLASYGNQVPATEGLSQVKTNQSLAEVVGQFCAAARIDVNHEASTTALTAFPLRGYAITAETNCWDAMKPLLPAFGVGVSEGGGQVRFYRRAQSMRSTIDPNEMGAYAGDDSPPVRYSFKRADPLSLPHSTSLTFVDPARDYQANTATASRSEGNAKSNVAVSLSLVLTADEGASTAALMHWDAWLGQIDVDFTLTDAWNGLTTGMAYGLPIAGQVVPYRITRKVRGANGLIEVEATSDEKVTYSAEVSGSSGTVSPPESTLIPQTRLVLLDMPILEDAHDDYGYYLILGAGDPSWERAKVQGSSDGVNFATFLDQPFSAVMGDVVGSLPEGPTTGLDDSLDMTSVLTVQLLHDGMALQSVSDAQLDDHANFAFVGADGRGEYVQFRTATKVAARTWQLTGLRRGRKGTDHALAGHGSGETFVLLGGEGVYRMVFGDASGWGDVLHFRAATLHQDESEATIIDFANSGEGKRPYSVVDVEGAWDGGLNATISWAFRSRLNGGGLGIDDRDEYEVEILNATPVRTIIATGIEAAAYSAADQTSDGLTPGDSIAGRVRQTSDVNDGRWRNFYLIGPGATPLTMEDNTTPIHLEDGTTPFELG